MPIASRLTALGQFTPIEVPEVAAALVAMCGIGLLLLARGVRRGQRHAWLFANALLLLAVVGNVTKGLDIEEAIIALLVVVFLVVHRDDFTAPANPSSWRRGLGAALLAVAVAIVGGTVGVAWRHPKLSLPKIVEAVAARLVGMKTVPLPDSIDRLVSPALLTVGVVIALSFCWLLFRPAVSPRLSSYRPLSRERARFIVEQYGVDSLSYFALRDDKEWFGFRDTLVAYRVHNGIALVSPDPIGPVGQRAEAWGAFREFADEHGWPVAVMGAGADWLPVYRASGMHDLYIGDEAVVDVRRFRLDGKQNKSLRQSVGRVEKAGYRVEFFDPARLAPDMEAKLRGLMTESRRGDVERGFSMTLGRVFEPDDRGLLLAVALDSEDRPAGFCQYVPARDRGLVARPDAPERGERRPERHHRVDRRQDHRAPSHRGFGRPCAQLRHVPGGARERSRRPARAACPEMDPRARGRLDADRIAVDVQREVPAGVARPVRGVRLARAHAERVDRGRAGGVVLRAAAHRSVLQAGGRRGARASAPAPGRAGSGGELDGEAAPAGSIRGVERTTCRGNAAEKAHSLKKFAFRS